MLVKASISNERLHLDVLAISPIFPPILLGPKYVHFRTSEHPMDVRFHVIWMFVFGRRFDVRFRTSNGCLVWTFYGEDIWTVYDG